MPAKPRFHFDGNGEFDEFIAKGVRLVKVERMDARAFWIGITLADGRTVHINTGIHRGQWFFTVDDADADADDEGKRCEIKKPACHRKHGKDVPNA